MSPGQHEGLLASDGAGKGREWIIWMCCRYTAVNLSRRELWSPSEQTNHLLTICLKMCLWDTSFPWVVLKLLCWQCLSSSFFFFFPFHLNPKAALSLLLIGFTKAAEERTFLWQRFFTFQHFQRLVLDAATGCDTLATKHGVTQGWLALTVPGASN